MAQFLSLWPFRGVFAAVLLFGCGGTLDSEPEWPAQSRQWYERANASYRVLDAEDAQLAIANALKADPTRAEVQELAAQIALSELDYARALKHTEGLESASARGIRARAFWYSGQVQEAGEELEVLLADPAVRDTWAEGIVKLAHLGRGRKPFSVTGELLAVMEMPRLNGTAMILPVELNGQPALAMLNTGATEVIVDAAAGRSPSWVTLRFDQRVEVKDVPALPQDLSALSRELNAPIKLLLGTHLLRHLNATVDFLGRQFVVRSFPPPPPPVASKVDLLYVRGGGMALRSRIGTGDPPPSFAFLVDTSSHFALVMDDAAWKRTSVPDASRKPVPGRPGLTHALLNQMQLGAFSLPQVPAISGVPIQEIKERLDVDLDGLLGSGLLGAFRVTWTDGGRALWLEEPPLLEEGEYSESDAVEPASPPDPAQPLPPNPAEPSR